MEKNNKKQKYSFEENIPTINSKYLNDTLTAAFLTPIEDLSGLPIALWGAPGISKSSRIKQIAKRLQLPIEAIFPSTMQPESVSGVLIPDMKGGVNTHLIVPAFRNLLKVEQGILFIDELSCAPEEVQAALMNVVLERKVEGQSFARGIRIIAAGNPLSSASAGWELTAPNANRFCHLGFPLPEIGAWKKWLQGNQESLDVEGLSYFEALLKASWDSTFAKNTALFTTFLERHGTLWHKMPDEDDPLRGSAWPSPRTWYFALQAATTVQCLGFAKEVEDYLVQGCVGIEAFKDLETYHRELKLPSVNAVLSGEWIPQLHELDVAFIALTNTSIVVLKALQEDSYDGINRFFEILHKNVRRMSDVVMPILKETISKSDKIRITNNKIGSAYTNLMRELINITKDKELEGLINA